VFSMQRDEARFSLQRFAVQASLRVVHHVRMTVDRLSEGLRWHVFW
jgi:hypothetical protein